MCSKEIKGEITLAGEQAAARERMSASKYRTSGSIFRTEFRQKSKQEEEWRLQVDKGRTGKCIRDLKSGTDLQRRH